MGLCLITTRIPVADIADHERTSALRRDLETTLKRCRSEAPPSGRRQRAGSRAEKVPATSSAASLGLTLLGSYLTDAYNGDICSYAGLLCDDPWILEATEFDPGQCCLGERSD